jgi:alcohol oxidase
MLTAGVYVTRCVLIVMMYTRASASDYDEWEKVYENPGWGPNELIPLLKKVYASIFPVSAVANAGTQTETYQVADDRPTHGTDGPLKVSLGGLATNIGEQFLQVARTFDPARATAPPDTDTNDLSTINVYTVGVSHLCSLLPLD